MKKDYPSENGDRIFFQKFLTIIIAAPIIFLGGNIMKIEKLLWLNEKTGFFANALKRKIPNHPNVDITSTHLLKLVSAVECDERFCDFVLDHSSTDSICLEILAEKAPTNCLGKLIAHSRSSNDIRERAQRRLDEAVRNQANKERHNTLESVYADSDPQDCICSSPDDTCMWK